MQCLGHTGFALGSPIFPSGCEGKLGVALESLQGLRDLTYGEQETGVGHSVREVGGWKEDSGRAVSR